MAYQTDEAGNSYYVPEAQIGGKQGDWDWGGSGLSTALSGAGTGAQIGSMFGGVPGALLGGLGGLALGGLYGAFTGGQELDRERAAEAARIEAQKQARQRMEQAYADQQSALESQRQLAEQLNPAAAIYGEQGRPGLLQMQQAQLAQQTAAQGARNRAALASRGLLGSGMEAGSMGALAGQQAAQQAQLQANAAQQYQQQQAARQQQLGQLGMQSAQLSRELASARSQMDQAALAGQQQQAQQIAQRNQQLIQAGLQGVSSGLGAYQQAQALQAQRDMVNLYRKQMGLPELPAQAAPFETQAQGAVDWLKNAGSQAAQGIGQFGQNVMSGLGQLGQGAVDGIGRIGPGLQSGLGQVGNTLMGAGYGAAEKLGQLGQGIGQFGQVIQELPQLPQTLRGPQGAMPSPLDMTGRRVMSGAQREVMRTYPEQFTADAFTQQMNAAGYKSRDAGIPQLLPNVESPLTLGNPRYTPGPFDKPTYPPLETLPPRQPRRSQRQSAASGLMFG